MNEQQYEEIKKRFDFDEWRNRNSLNENLFIWNFFFLGDEFPNFQLHRTRSLAAPPIELKAAGVRALDREIAGNPRLVQSVWRPGVRQTGAFLNVDIYECASRAAAHELLIRILGEFQSPLLARQTESTAGDIAFTHPGSGIYLFARANQVAVIRSIGLVTIRVTDLVQQFDKELREKPPTPVGQVKPNIRHLGAPRADLQVGSPVPLDIEAAQPSGGPIMYKIFSQGGEVIAEAGQLLYEPTAAGEQPLDVYVIAPDRSVATERIQFTIK